MIKKFTFQRKMYSVTIARAFCLFMRFVTRLSKLPQETIELILILEYIHITLQIIINLMNFNSFNV